MQERFLLEKYGTAYKEYMNRTPKWIGIPKTRKRISMLFSIVDCRR